MEGILARFSAGRIFTFTYLANFFLSLHYFITVYVNSSLLADHFTPREVSFLYIAGSLLNIVVLLFIATPLRKLGNRLVLAILSILEIGAVLGLAFTNGGVSIAFFFIIHQALPPLLLLSLDIFLESATRSEKNTGGIRGLFLTTTNLALVLSPLLLSATIIGTNFSSVYIISAIFLVPLLPIALINLRGFIDPHYQPLNIIHSLRTFLKERDIRNVFFANFLLQFFYAWMVIYTPLYLRNIIGMSWQEIGVIFAIMLLPFVLFELPLGSLADRKIGEKELMITGFVIISLFTALIFFVSGQSFLIWAFILFMTRTGASFIEITTESYFFKKVDGKDTDLISFFRSSRPLSFVIGPAVGIIALYFVPLGSLFVILAAIMFSGVAFAFSIKDTR